MPIVQHTSEREVEALDVPAFAMPHIDEPDVTSTLVGTPHTPIWNELLAEHYAELVDAGVFDAEHTGAPGPMPHVGELADTAPDDEQSDDREDEPELDDEPGGE